MAILYFLLFLAGTLCAGAAAVFSYRVSDGRYYGGRLLAFALMFYGIAWTIQTGAGAF